MQKLSNLEKKQLTETLNFVNTDLLNIDKDFLVRNGYAVFDLLNSEDLLATKKIIYETMIESLRSLKVSIPFNSYDEMLCGWSDLFHIQMIRKKNRLFSATDSKLFMRLQGIRKLLSACSEFSLGEITYGSLQTEAREEIYFRIVRPLADSDVGPLHADCWYHEIYKNFCKKFNQLNKNKL
jgi:hypothetical protein